MFISNPKISTNCTIFRKSINTMSLFYTFGVLKIKFNYNVSKNTHLEFFHRWWS